MERPKTMYSAPMVNDFFDDGGGMELSINSMRTRAGLLFVDIVSAIEKFLSHDFIFLLTAGDFENYWPRDRTFFTWRTGRPRASQSVS